MGKFRDLMDRDLQIRGYSPATRGVYLRCVRQFVSFCRRPADQATLEDIHRYQHHLTQVREVRWSTFNQAVCALRFFYLVTLQKPWEVARIPYRKTGRRPLPTPSIARSSRPSTPAAFASAKRSISA